MSGPSSYHTKARSSVIERPDNRIYYVTGVKYAPLNLGYSLQETPSSPVLKYECDSVFEPIKTFRPIELALQQWIESGNPKKTARFEWKGQLYRIFRTDRIHRKYIIHSAQPIEYIELEIYKLNSTQTSHQYHYLNPSDKIFTCYIRKYTYQPQFFDGDLYL